MIQVPNTHVESATAMFQNNTKLSNVTHGYWNHIKCDDVAAKTYDQLKKAEKQKLLEGYTL